MCGGLGFGVEDQLCQAESVTQVYENEIAVVAIGMGPTGEGNFPADIGDTKLAAGMCPFKHFENLSKKVFFVKEIIPEG